MRYLIHLALLNTVNMFTHTLFLRDRKDTIKSRTFIRKNKVYYK